MKQQTTSQSRGKQPVVATAGSGPGSLVITQLPEYQLLCQPAIQASPEAPGGMQYEELHRTRCALHCLDLLYDGSTAAYQQLTAPQDQTVRLTSAQFERAHRWVRQCLPSQNRYNLMRYIMLIHDSGKNQAVVQAVQGYDIDHDAVLNRLLSDRYTQQRRQLLPTFDQLPTADRALVRSVLGQQLNFGQYIQLEAPAAMLADFWQCREPVRSLYLLHALLDIAGAAGHINEQGSIVLTAPTYHTMELAMKSLSSPITPEKQYAEYAAERYNAALATGHDASTDVPASVTPEQLLADPSSMAQARLLAMLRCHTEQHARDVRQAYRHQLPPVQAILDEMLSRDGVQNRAVLPYYAPALLKGLATHYDMSTAVRYLAHVLQEAHMADVKAGRADQNGVVTADLAELAAAANAGTLDPSRAEIRFRYQGEVLVPERRQRPDVQIADVPPFDGEVLRGLRVIYVGMGGGSDGLQAAALGRLHQRAYGVEPVAMVSVRAQEKPLQHTGRRVGQHAVEITTATRAIGDWRFLEHLVAQDQHWPAPVYILNSMQPAEVTSDLQLMVEQTGAQAVIGIDTGGDVLYRNQSAGPNQMDATPDQDAAVLMALQQLSQQNPHLAVHTAVVAPGVDTPDDADQVLAAAGARLSDIMQQYAAEVMATYRQWRMDGSGSEDGLYGKTPLVLLAGLRGDYGLQPLPLPRANAVDSHNPWRIFTMVQPASSYVMMMSAQALYRVVA